MPAITLGLAEVEERLRALCRRWNAVTAQHAAYLGVSTIVLALTALVILGLRATPSIFRVAMWAAVLLSVGTVMGCAIFLRRRWLNVHAAARLADRRGALTDRLATLVDLRMRPRPSRLAPLLIAQALSLSARWQPQRIVPRRVPRSVFLLVAALLALASTAFFSRRVPAPRPAAATAGGDVSGQRRSAPSSGSSDAARLGTLASATNEMGESRILQASEHPNADGDRPHGDSPNAGAISPTGSGQPGRDGGREQPDSRLAALPDRLQAAIRRAFQAGAVDKAHDLAEPARKDAGDRGDVRDDRQGERDPRRHDGSDADESAARQARESSAQGSDAGTRKQPGESKGRGTKGQNSAAPQQSFDGSAPAAGDGSNPAGLLDGAASGQGAGEGGAKTFKLTITSFLRAVEQQGKPPQPPGKRAGVGVAANTETSAPPALSDRQLNDDALRKAEIPPEYEDIVRQVYSDRADSQ